MPILGTSLTLRKALGNRKSPEERIFPRRALPDSSSSVSRNFRSPVNCSVKRKGKVRKTLPPGYCRWTSNYKPARHGAVLPQEVLLNFKSLLAYKAVSPRLVFVTVGRNFCEYTKWFYLMNNASFHLCFNVKVNHEWNNGLQFHVMKALIFKKYIFKYLLWFYVEKEIYFTSQFRV